VRFAVDPEVTSENLVSAGSVSEFEQGSVNCRVLQNPAGDQNSILENQTVNSVVTESTYVNV